MGARTNHVHPPIPATILVTALIVVLRFDKAETVIIYLVVKCRHKGVDRFERRPSEDTVRRWDIKG